MGEEFRRRAAAQQLWTPDFRHRYDRDALPVGSTFTRSGTAYSWDPATGWLVPYSADVPRYYYHPVTHQPMGILLEPIAATNSIPSSDSLAGWGGGTSDADAYNDPKNGGHGSFLRATGTITNGVLYKYIGVVYTVGNILGISVFLRPGNGCNYGFLAFQSDITQNYVSAVFDLVNGVRTQTSVGSSSGTHYDSWCEPAPDGWVRCCLVGSFLNKTSVSYLEVGAAKQGTGNTFSAFGEPQANYSAGEGVYVWGAQAEPNTVSSFQYNASGTTTRAAEVHNLDTSFIKGFRVDRGFTLASRHMETNRHEASDTFLAHISDGTTSNELIFTSNSIGSDVRFRVAMIAGGVSQLSTIADTADGRWVPSRKCWSVGPTFGYQAQNGVLGQAPQEGSYSMPTGLQTTFEIGKRFGSGGGIIVKDLQMWFASRDRTFVAVSSART